MVHDGKPEDALALVEPIITKALADEAKDPEAMCPSVAAAMVAALIGKSANGLAVTVSVEDDWCEAMLLKGFALGDLKRFDEAAAVLGVLAGHDRTNPNYLAEYGFALRSSGKPDEALAAYKQALTAANGLHDKGARAHWRAVASRGIGYIAFDRAHWDEAEKAYKASLKDEPDNAIALSELKLIAEHRGK